MTDTISELLDTAIRFGVAAERATIVAYARSLGLGWFAAALEEDKHDSAKGVSRAAWSPTEGERRSIADIDDPEKSIRPNDPNLAQESK